MMVLFLLSACSRATYVTLEPLDTDFVYVFPQKDEDNNVVRVEFFDGVTMRKNIRAADRRVQDYLDLMVALRESERVIHGDSIDESIERLLPVAPSVRELLLTSSGPKRALKSSCLDRVECNSTALNMLADMMASTESYDDEGLRSFFSAATHASAPDGDVELFRSTLLNLEAQARTELIHYLRDLGITDDTVITTAVERNDPSIAMEHLRETAKRGLAIELNIVSPDGAIVGVGPWARFSVTHCSTRVAALRVSDRGFRADGYAQRFEDGVQATTFDYVEPLTGGNYTFILPGDLMELIAPGMLKNKQFSLFTPGRGSKEKTKRRRTLKGQVRDRSDSCLVLQYPIVTVEGVVYQYRAFQIGGNGIRALELMEIEEWYRWTFE